MTVDAPVLAAVLTVLCLGTGLGCLALALARVGDRTAMLTHAVMGVTMAGMFSPWGDPVPAWLGILGFTVLGTWFGAALLRGDRRTATPEHLVISAAAMVFMYVLHGQHPMTGTAGSGPHAGHHMAGGTSLLALPLALVLAGYFVWHAWTCADRARVPSEPTGTTRTRTAVRLEPVAHGAMSALMAAMFLGMV